MQTFLALLNRRTAMVSGLALLSTFLADRLGLAAAMPTTIISIAVIFPIVFSINAAYARREEALRYLASFRANTAGIYFAHRDWGSQQSGAHERARTHLRVLVDAIQNFLQADAESDKTSVDVIYREFSALSRSIELMRSAGLTGTETSRISQYLRGMIEDFELIRNIATYRTPVPLRAYSHVFLNAFPIIFGPYFAHLSQAYIPVIGYLIAFLYAVVLVSLDNIQEELENPFDARGVDDIHLEELNNHLVTLNACD